MKVCVPSGGFTLIELLVVVSIIALLVAILLPSLNSARKSSQAAVCTAHLNGAGKAMQLWAVDNNGKFPGPNTSGKKITNGYVFKNTSRTEPTQNCDWITPALGDTFSLPSDRKGKLRAIFNNQMKCPSNGEFYSGEYPSASLFTAAEARTLSVISYSSPIGMHINAGGKSDPVPPGKSAFASTIDVTTSGHQTSVQGVFSPQLKVWAMDGARYVDAAGVCTYNNLPYQDDGGNFMATAPAVISTSALGDPYRIDRTTLKVQSLGRTFAFRHFDTINAVFFDTHAAKLNLDEAIKPQYFFPSGSTVRNAANTFSTTDRNNDKLP